MKVGALWKLSDNNYCDCCNYDLHSLKVMRVSFYLLNSVALFCMFICTKQRARALKVSAISWDPHGKWGAVSHKTFLANAICKPKKKKIHMVHNISQMKNKASQGRSLGGFWTQIARNKCAILILALKLPFLEWSQYHNLCSTAHTKPETLLVFWFAFPQKKSSELWMRFATPPTPTLEAQENSVT